MSYHFFSIHFDKTINKYYSNASRLNICFSFRTHYGAYLRAWSKGIDWYVGAADENENCEQWIIERHDDKVNNDRIFPSN